MPEGMFHQLQFSGSAAEDPFKFKLGGLAGDGTQTCLGTSLLVSAGEIWV